MSANRDSNQFPETTGNRPEPVHDLQRCACMDCEDRRSVFVVEAWADLYDAATGPAADLWETVRYWQDRSWPDELLDDLRRARQAAIADGDAKAAQALVKAARAL